MEILNISERKFKALKPLELDKSIINTESKLFILERKNTWINAPLVLKKFYEIYSEVFSNKLYTINELISKKEIINIPELVMPYGLCTVGGEVVGYLMPYIENINFNEILNSNDFTNEAKVGYLKEIGELLEKIKNVRKYTSVKDFYLNDLHEQNFILNKKTGKINVVDLDSAKIGKNLECAARYLSPFAKIFYLPKYKFAKSPVGGVFVACENTDIYCYIIVIFKYFFGDNISKLSIEDFYVYLEYLSSIGVSKELLDIFSYIYSGKSNKNPYEYLEELTHFYGRTHKNTFEAVRKRMK